MRSPIKDRSTEVSLREYQSSLHIVQTSLIKYGSFLSLNYATYFHCQAKTPSEG